MLQGIERKSWTQGIRKGTTYMRTFATINGTALKHQHLSPTMHGTGHSLRISVRTALINAINRCFIPCCVTSSPPDPPKFEYGSCGTFPKPALADC